VSVFRILPVGLHNHKHITTKDQALVFPTMDDATATHRK